LIRLVTQQLRSPVGKLLLVSDGPRLAALAYEGYEAQTWHFLRARWGEVELEEARRPLPAAAALEAYFAGDLGALDAIAVAARGTPFQEEVWAALRRIPAGTTATYGELAARLGRPGASRAVGHANGQNPVAIVVPCHRVVGARGVLAGYGGGLERKRWLLAHEAPRTLALR
jgi:methylated-DNA-[protein]-cysteine S-methyltransferase